MKTSPWWIKHIDICWYSHGSYGLKAYSGAVKCREVSAELQKNNFALPHESRKGAATVEQMKCIP